MSIAISSKSAIIRSFVEKSHIKLSTTEEIGYYCRGDGWFCASDVCKDLDTPIFVYLNLVESLANDTFTSC
jgi:hypothetical protein